MSKDSGSLLSLRGVVVECRPSGMFVVEIEEPKYELIATISGKIRKNNIRVLLGDSVDVEVSVYDLTKGRIVYRHKS
jgi:translation initiation factor IF-1